MSAIDITSWDEGEDIFDESLADKNAPESQLPDIELPLGDIFEDEADPPSFGSLEPFPPALPHELAACISDEDVRLVCEKHKITMDELAFIINRADFKRQFSTWQQQLTTEGNSFKMKLKAMAEDFLPQLHRLMSSELTAPSVRLETFKYITKCAELEPVKKEAGGDVDDKPKIVIEIKNFSPSGQNTQINIAPIQREIEEEE